MNTNTSRPSPTTLRVISSAVFSGRPVSLASTCGRPWALKPHCDRSTETGSRKLARHWPNSPLSVMYAEIASTVSTTTERRLPPPTRTRFLLVQPAAIVMPTPNRAPPSSKDNQGSTGRW
ncbi:hypothetical protein D9M69_532230 [compost metagenome]